MTQSGPPGAQPPPPPPSSPPPQPPADWQSTPQQPSAAPPPAAGSGMPAWTANITSQAPVAGPAGFYYADVPNRIIAYIIDFIIVFVALLIVAIVVAAIVPATTLGAGFTLAANPAFALIYGLLAAIVSAAYFIYTWVAMRGTPGMKVLGMQLGHEADGRTITYQQALTRWAVLFGPFLVADIVGRFALNLGLILQLVGIIWFIVLLITTAQSPTKQGLHDRYAKTMVVKAARTVA